MLSASRFASRLIENQNLKRSFSTLLRNVSGNLWFCTVLWSPQLRQISKDVMCLAGVM